MIDETLPKFLESPVVVFRLLAPGHIPTINKMLKEGTSWDEIGKHINWIPETA